MFGTQTLSPTELPSERDWLSTFKEGTKILFHFPKGLGLGVAGAVEHPLEYFVGTGPGFSSPGPAVGPFFP